MNLILMPMVNPYPLIFGILAFVTILMFVLNFKKVTKTMISSAIAIVALLLVLGLVFNNVIPVMLSFAITIVGVLLAVTNG